MAHLIRSKPDENMRRFYEVQLAPTLFGEWSLWREWGRSGQAGKLRLQTFESQAQAEAAQARSIQGKLRRGYLYAARQADHL